MKYLKNSVLKKIQAHNPELFAVEETNERLEILRSRHEED